jgi:hypothetical protein
MRQVGPPPLDALGGGVTYHEDVVYVDEDHGLPDGALLHRVPDVLALLAKAPDTTKTQGSEIQALPAYGGKAVIQQCTAGAGP